MYRLTRVDGIHEITLVIRDGRSIDYGFYISKTTGLLLAKGFATLEEAVTFAIGELQKDKI